MTEKLVRPVGVEHFAGVYAMSVAECPVALTLLAGETQLPDPVRSGTGQARLSVEGSRPLVKAAHLRQVLRRRAGRQIFRRSRVDHPEIVSVFGLQSPRLVVGVVEEREQARGRHRVLVGGERPRRLRQVHLGKKGKRYSPQLRLHGYLADPVRSPGPVRFLRQVREPPDLRSAYGDDPRWGGQELERGDSVPGYGLCDVTPQARGLEPLSQCCSLFFG